MEKIEFLKKEIEDLNWKINWSKQQVEKDEMMKEICEKKLEELINK